MPQPSCTCVRGQENDVRERVSLFRTRAFGMQICCSSAMRLFYFNGSFTTRIIIFASPMVSSAFGPECTVF